MEPLRSLLNWAIPTPLSASSDEPDLEALYLCPSVAEAAAKLAELEATIAALPDEAVSTRQKAEWGLARLRKTLRYAELRAAIQATRPDGCWCLGLGGDGARYIPASGDEDEPIRTWDRYCSCEDGTAAKARDDIERRHFQANRQAYVRRQLFADADVPSRFAGCSFETYPVTPSTAEAVARVRAWAADPTTTRSLLLHGLYGTGKTGLAVSAMRQSIANFGHDALFIAVPTLLDRIRATYSDDAKSGTERQVVENVKETKLLVLDDLGAERATGWVQEKLFTIINHRHDEELPTIFTSNLDPAGIAAHLGERTAWRIVEMSEVIRLDGPNLRERA